VIVSGEAFLTTVAPPGVGQLPLPQEAPAITIILIFSSFQPAGMWYPKPVPTVSLFFSS
jgi:hypothetical protein